MKKISLMLTGLLAVASLTGCNETWDDNPVMRAADPASANFLNNPELRETYITLSEADANKNAALHMTCSQPDYGYAAVVNYVVQVALNEDFTTPAVAGAPAYFETATALTDCSAINPIGDEVAEGICKLMNWQDADDVKNDLQFRKVYMRLRAYIPQDEELTSIVSNVVCFEHIKVTYYAASVPGKPVPGTVDNPTEGLYIRGVVNNWGDGGDAGDINKAGTDAFKAAWGFVTTDKRGIYVIEDITMPAGEFKLASTAWGDPYNWGTSGSLTIGQELKLEYNGGNINLKEDFKGRIVVYNRSGNWTVLLEKEGTFVPGEYNK